MTTFQSPILPSPFGNHSHPKPYIFGNIDLPYFGSPGASATSLPSACRSRQISPSSVLSATSVPPTQANDENRDPLCRTSDNPLFNRERAASLQALPASTQSQPLGDFSTSWSRFRNNVKHIRELNQYDGFTPGDKGDDSSEKPDPMRIALTQLRKNQKGGYIQEMTKSAESSSVPAALASPGRSSIGHHRGLKSEDIEPWTDVQCEDELHPSSNPPPPSVDQIDPETEIPLPAPHILGHFKRLSTSSSAFVHTMKTASLSNASLSILPRSLRFGRSSDNRSVNARFSVDSDRPTTTSSIDEASVRRGIKRRQILQEIVSSEMSYVADLKALVYLYSTLLASASSLSNHTRSAIQRNVVDILHLHEHLVEQLHKAGLNATSRRWAETASPRKLGVRRHLRSDSLEAARLRPSTERLRRHTNSSGYASTAMHPADPIEVVEVCRIFKSSISRFFAYEEYCAKYEILMLELSRHKATHQWASYETGIESLAKSIVALDDLEHDRKKGLTVGDLLIKPIQRVCKYPLLVADLHKCTPVVDCPTSHAEIDLTLQCLREAVTEINYAADNPLARRQIQRRWLLNGKLNFNDHVLRAFEFRLLGRVRLCGVLHVAYQTRGRVDGYYALCILFDAYFVLAVPAGAQGKFDVVALIHLNDLKLESASDGKGLQCPAALFTWKVCFEADGQLFELVLSACSATEEERWKQGFKQQNHALTLKKTPPRQLLTAVSLDLKPFGVVFGQAGTLTRRLSVQRAATVGNRASVCQVIIRGTHNPQDLQDFRHPYPAAINRSQSHLTTHRIVVLAPKRSERARLESTLADVWTKDKLPYPGMIVSRGGQIIRASAGSLVRKLSLASMHGPFTRRSTSLTLTNRKSHEAFAEPKPEQQDVFEIEKERYEASPTVRGSPDKEIPYEKEEMAAEDTCAQPKRLGEGHFRRTTRKQRGMSKVAPEDLARDFYPESQAQYQAQETEEVEQKLRSRKRWSNPLSMLKNLSADGVRHMLYSTK